MGHGRARCYRCGGVACYDVLTEDMEIITCCGLDIPKRYREIYRM